QMAGRIGAQCVADLSGQQVSQRPSRQLPDGVEGAGPLEPRASDERIVEHGAVRAADMRLKLGIAEIPAERARIECHVASSLGAHANRRATTLMAIAAPTTTRTIATARRSIARGTAWAILAPIKVPTAKPTASSAPSVGSRLPERKLPAVASR